MVNSRSVTVIDDVGGRWPRRASIAPVSRRAVYGYRAREFLDRSGPGRRSDLSTPPRHPDGNRLRAAAEHATNPMKKRPDVGTTARFSPVAKRVGTRLYRQRRDDVHRRLVPHGRHRSHLRAPFRAIAPRGSILFKRCERNDPITWTQRDALGEQFGCRRSRETERAYRLPRRSVSTSIAASSAIAPPRSSAPFTAGRFR